MLCVKLKAFYSMKLTTLHVIEKSGAKQAKGRGGGGGGGAREFVDVITLP